MEKRTLRQSYYNYWGGHNRRKDVLNITSKSIFYVAFERKDSSPDLIIVDEETPSASGIISLI